MSKDTIIPSDHAEDSIREMIYIIRGKRVMFDRDLARLYKTSTRILNQAVRRNPKRFPTDFMFQLTKQELREVITNCDNLRDLKFSPQPPHVFTENGVAMLSSVLNSEYAIRANVRIMRTFTRIREYLSKHRDLEKRIDELEKRYDTQFQSIFDAIRELINPPENPNKRPIGFHA